MTGKTKILVVDDERINLRLLEGMLSGTDMEVHTARDGETALARAKENEYALVLLDVMMPGLDGFETAERLRADPANRHLPIMFVTAISKEQKHVFKGYEMGAVDYLFKPVEPEILKSKVRVFKELYEKHRDLGEATRRLAGTVAQLQSHRNALEESEKRYRTVAEYTFDWEAWLSSEGEFIYISPSCERISGLPKEEFFKDPGQLERLVQEEDRESWRRFMAETRAGSQSSLDYRITRTDGSRRWVSQVNSPVPEDGGSKVGVRFSIRDITERKNMELALRHQALHDPLTDIANRTLLQDRINQALERSRRSEDKPHWAVIFMDLDRFKVVNDSLGHAMGDELLKEISARLLTCVRATDTVSRFGGDEFVIVLEDLENPDEAMRVINRIREEVARPFFIDNHEIQTAASLGVVLSPNEFDRPEDLIQKANLAMYKAKEAGRDRYHIFNEEMLEKAVRLMNMESDMRRAIAGNEFHLAYQPIFSLADGVLAGFEALARWNHPERGPISPGEFIPVAEDSGLIVELGRWVLAEACSTLAGWIGKMNTNGLTMAVNISGRQFHRSDLVAQVRQAIAETRLPPDRLKLEITETAIMDDVQASTKTLGLLKNEGVTLAIDDFGTGYSSMSYLQRFPLDQLKIDLSFVRGIDKNQESMEIVRGIINLAHSLRLKTVAEGIERREQQNLLYSMQCEFGQGFLYAKPMPREEAEAFILERGA